MTKWLLALFVALPIIAYGETDYQEDWLGE